MLGAAVLAATTDWIAFALVGMGACLALGALRPALFLALFLVARPCLDDFSDLTVGARSANVGGFLALTLILSAALAASRQRQVTWPTAAPALLLALAVSAVSAVQARLELGHVVGTVPISELLRFGALFAAYVVAANLYGTVARARLLVVVVGLSGVIPGLLGIAEWIRGAPIAEGLALPRISGPFVGPVPFGTFLAVTALILIFLPKDWLPRWARIAALSAVCVPLVGTLSREGWFVFIAGVLMLAWRGRKSLVLGVVLAAVALLVSVPSVRERVLPVSQSAVAATPRTYESWHWRVDNWATLLDKWHEKPVFGYGLRSTIFVNPRAPVESRGQPGRAFEAHSLVVRLLVEGGIVLFAAYLVFFAVLLRSVWRLARDAWELQSLGRLLLVIWTLIVVVSVSTDDPLAETATMLPILALTGALDAAHQRQHRPRVK